MTPPKGITYGKWVKDGHVIRDEAGKEIASCLGDGGTFVVDVANARLMTSAKELAAKLAKVLETKAVLNTASHHSFLDKTGPDELRAAIEAHETALAEAKAELLNAGYTE